MNYLAHALLAEPHAFSVIGNLAGDLIKGPLDGHALHPRVADGVRRHRRVDALTDKSPALAELKALFPREQRRYSGIVLDVLFDYYLCRHWARFSDFGRDEFVEGVYRILCDARNDMPLPLAELAPRWVQADWLQVYASLDGVEAVLDRVSQRLASRDVKRGARSRALRPALGKTVELCERFDAQLSAGFISVFSHVQGALDGVCLARPDNGSARGTVFSLGG